jgi:hypothetical protein
VAHQGEPHKVSEAVCLASGPSLTPEDVETVRKWRRASPERWVIVVNTTFRFAPWADELYAMDRAWWRMYAEEVAQVFQGERTTPLKHIRVAKHRTIDHGKNSGIGAIALAISRGAKRIMLLGYDAKYSPEGKRHHHGDHPEGLGNAVSVARWPGDFERAARRFAGPEIINCSRDTALTCWPRAKPEDVF